MSEQQNVVIVWDVGQDTIAPLVAFLAPVLDADPMQLRLRDTSHEPPRLSNLTMRAVTDTAVEVTGTVPVTSASTLTSTHPVTVAGVRFELSDGAS